MEDKNLQTLANLYESLDNKSTLEEVVKAFELIVEVVTKTYSLTQDEIENLRSMFNQAITEAKNDINEYNASHKARLMSYCEKEMSKMSKTHMAKIKELDSKMSELKDGEDADEEVIVEKVISILDEREAKKPKEVEPEESGDEIIDKINSDESDKKIKREKIEELDEELKKIREEISSIPRGGSNGRRIPIVKRINLSNQLDGVIKSFSLPRDTVDVLGVFGSQFPVNFNPGVDWSFTGNTLTLGDNVGAPESGQSLYCLIETLFYGKI